MCDAKLISRSLKLKTLASKLSKMPKITIDNREVEVPQGATILDAARKLGIDIPTLCHLPDFPANTSCMVCVVKVDGRERLLPSCATVVRDGMHVENDIEEVRQARKSALELLLSDHLGDCIAPCHNTCPAHMNIPLMIRQIAAGQLHDAIVTIKQEIALPAVLGRICPAPCEKACRRRAHDNPVSICLLKRFAADTDLNSDTPYLPQRKTYNNKKVAIVGAGPAGLSAAYYLQQQGCRCTVIDDHDKPGGMLRCGIPNSELPHKVLDAEIAQIEKLGVKFRLNTKITKSSFKRLQKDYDAVLVATGPLDQDQIAEFNIPAGTHGVKVDTQTLRTEIPGVFAAGDCIRKRQLAVRAGAEGKTAAHAIIKSLNGKTTFESPNLYSTHIGKLQNGEMEKFLAEAADIPRLEPKKKSNGGFTPDQAHNESSRCLHCDCRKPDTCKLRQYSQQYHAQTNRYKAPRRTFEQLRQHADIIFEPGKCIACGICIQITARHREDFGLTFIGRGFDVRVKVPLNQNLDQALKKTAAQCVNACPTGALAFKNQPK